ncbi:MAG: phage protein Gp27 family protein [Hypericibacter sp.]
MARPSTIQRLPGETQDLIRKLRGAGKFNDEIRDELARIGVHVSRSALGRYLSGLDTAGALDLKGADAAVPNIDGRALQKSTLRSRVASALRGLADRIDPSSPGTST